MERYYDVVQGPVPDVSLAMFNVSTMPGAGGVERSKMMPILNSLGILLEHSILYIVICINKITPYYEAEFCSW